MILQDIPTVDASTAPYLLAYMSSSAIEVVAVAVGLSMIAFTLLRRLPPAAPARAKSARPARRFDVLHLSKLVLPLFSLGVTGWIWVSTQSV
jgi:hypothetical protein